MAREYPTPAVERQAIELGAKMALAALRLASVRMPRAPDVLLARPWTIRRESAWAMSSGALE